MMSLLAMPTVLLAQAPSGGWVGKRVVPRTTEFTLKSDARTIVVKDGFALYDVEEVEGTRLRLSQAGEGGGWVEANSVIAVEAAIRHFTEEIRTHPGEARGYILRATVWRDFKKDFDVALADCINAIQLDPTSPVPYTTRGLVWLAKGDFNRALGDFTEAITLDPADAPAWFARARANRAKGEEVRTLDDLAATLRADPSFAPAYALRGEIRAKAGDHTGALADLSEAIRLDRRNRDALVARSTIYLAKEDLDQALADLNAAVKLDPKHQPTANLLAEAKAKKAEWDARPKTAAGLLARGIERRIAGDFQGALTDLSQTIKLDPGLVNGFIERAIVWLAQGRLAGAIADLDKAIRLDPKSAEVHYLRGMIRLFDNQPNAALADFDEAGRIDPQAWSRAIDRIRVRPIHVYKPGPLSGVATLATLVAPFSPGVRFIGFVDRLLDTPQAAKVEIVGVSDLDALKQQVKALYEKRSADRSLGGNLDAAISDLDEAIRLAPNWEKSMILARRAKILARRAEIRKDRGDLDGAVKDLNEAVSIDPNAETLARRAEIRKGRGDLNGADKDLDRAVRLDPRYRLNRAQDRFARRDYEGAFEDFSRAAERSPTDPWPHYYRAVCAFLTGRELQRDADTVVALTARKDVLASYVSILGYFGAKRAGEEILARLRLSDAATYTAQWVRNGETFKAQYGWPHPIVRFLQREIDEKALLALAIDDDKKTEVRCFLGLDHLIAGRAAAAREHFRWVKEHGARENIQYSIAVAELARLEAKAKP
jgi:tetratricopeptide (TPR) repeat protein